MSEPSNDLELGLEVPVAAIDRELRKLWTDDAARTNASLMNLVLYSEQAGSLRENSAVVRELTREHACRAILVEMDRDVPEPSVRAWITAHCHLADGRKSVCCEQIAFKLTGRVSGRLRNTVFAHLNSDLPLVFWWQGELSDVFGEGLYWSVDRLVFDSAGWADPGPSFARIGDALERAGSQLIVHDLEWTRSGQFRLGVAALFDDPAALAGLCALREVEIVHHPAHRVAALQLLAWLAFRAGWTGCGAHGPDGYAMVAADGGAIRAVLREGAAAESLQLLRMSSDTLEIRVSRDAGSSHVARELQCGGRVLRSFAPADPDAEEGLVRLQLGRGGGNKLFRKVLPVMRKMMER